MDENKIPDPHRMTRQEAIRYLDVNEETFDNWVERKCPKILEDGMKKPLFHLGEVVKWRVGQEKKKNKIVKSESDGSEKTVGDIELITKQKVLEQELRKKIRENDLADGFLCDRKQMEDKYFRLGRNLRDNLMSKPQVYGPQLNQVSGFDATTYLRKEFEKLCNSLADLNIMSDEDYARELHEYFMAGFDYVKS